MLARAVVIVHAGMSEGWVRREEATIAAERRRRNEERAARLVGAGASLEEACEQAGLDAADYFPLTGAVRGIVSRQWAEMVMRFVERQRDARRDAEYGPCWRCEGMGV